MPTKVIKLYDRRPDVNPIKVGNENDNNAERIRFMLPERFDDATVYLFLSIDGYSDVVKLEDRIFIPERRHTQYVGEWTAYLQAVADDDVVWHSDPFRLRIGNLPPTGKQIEQQYPTAIDEALRAVDTLTGVGARAETLPPGSQATVSFEEDADGNRTIVYGIPRGRDGTGSGEGDSEVAAPLNITFTIVGENDDGYQAISDVSAADAVAARIAGRVVQAWATSDLVTINMALTGWFSLSDDTDSVQAIFSAAFDATHRVDEPAAPTPIIAGAVLVGNVAYIRNSALGVGGVDFTTDNTLALEDGVLRVNTTDVVAADNTLPITSAGVQTVVGNINALLETI